MLINTHFIISKSVIQNLESHKSFFLSDKNFIYGNIKPDISSKYVLKKHYMDESLPMIFNQIDTLCNLTLDTLKKYFSISRLSQEVGVICHFLCDFFTTPHSERWEFSHSMNKHIIYERELASYARDINFSNYNLDNQVATNFEAFFNNLYSEYKSCKFSFENDIKYSLCICNTLVNYISDSILLNTVNSYNFKNCI